MKNKLKQKKSKKRDGTSFYNKKDYENIINNPYFQIGFALGDNSKEKCKCKSNKNVKSSDEDKIIDEILKLLR